MGYGFNSQQKIKNRHTYALGAGDLNRTLLELRKAGQTAQQLDLPLSTILLKCGYLPQIALQKSPPSQFKQEILDEARWKNKERLIGASSLSSNKLRLKLIMVAFGMLLSLFITRQAGLFFIAIIATLFFYLINCLRLAACIYIPLTKTSQSQESIPTINIKSQFSALPPDHELPIYTILVPLFKEENIALDLIRALLALDYPPPKLDIKILLEEDDHKTRAILESLVLPTCFEIIIVPESQPQTKPKALNYGLQFATGEYVVIYDAEDRPDPGQLKKALTKFLTGPENLACIQAKLNYYNPHQNWLTKQFTIEYTSLFDGFLPTLKLFDIPIPLGGTSNHFKYSVLKDLDGWDPYNVTEDADLGMRLYRKGLKVDIINSTTYEEANSNLAGWIKQRTRWLKGWMVTYLVHMYKPGQLLKDLGLWRFTGFQIVMGGLISSSLIHPIYLAFCLYLLSPLNNYSLFEHLTNPLVSLSIFNLFFGYISVGLLGLITIKRRNLNGLLIAIITLPAYWFLVSLAGLRALYQIFTSPFHWEKTRHGLYKAANKKEV